MHILRIKPFTDLTATEYHRIVRAREEVFHLEQQITCADADDADLRSVFLWLEQEGHVTAFLRIIPAGVAYAEASVGRVLVAAACRRQGLCRRIMGEALAHIAAAWGPQPVRISAQLHLAPFYESLGFERITSVYEEAGIPHVGMLRP